MGNITIMQGDQYSIPFAGTENGEPLDTSNIEEIEFCVGDIRKCWPREVTRAENGDFLFPLTQQETFKMYRTQQTQVRVKYVDGSVTVIGSGAGAIDVKPSNSKVVL